MHVVSVQLGTAHSLDLDTRTITTGIDKIPVEEIVVQIGGVAGDVVVNEKHHGGRDQAVYAYSAGDYAWWEQQLGRALTPGMFGENLTISHAPDVIRAGDRLRAGDVLLEVSAPRNPCATFSAQMGEADWIRRFRDAQRPGFYCRVLEPGTIRAGNTMEWISAPVKNISLREMVDHAYAGDVPAAGLQRALASPISHRARAQYQSRLL